MEVNVFDKVSLEDSHWYYTGSQVYCYKLSRYDLYSSTWKFVKNKLMMQVGIA